MKFIYVVACSCSLFILISGKYSILWIRHNLFTHSTVDRYLTGFQFLAIKRKAAANILMPDSGEPMEAFLSGMEFLVGGVCIL